MLFPRVQDIARALRVLDDSTGLVFIVDSYSCYVAGANREAGARCPLLHA